MQLTQKRQFKGSQAWTICLVVIGGLGTAIAAYWVWRGTPSTEKAIPEPTASVQVQTLAVQVKANGIVQAQQKINLSPQESGRIAQLYVQEGDRVSQGQVVAHMDGTRLEAQIQQYQAAVAKAQAELAEKLAGNRPEEVAQAKARVATEAANVQQVIARSNQAQKEVERYRSLVNEGAVAQVELDRWLNAQAQEIASVASAQARLQEQQQGLRQLQEGTRAEEIAAAQGNLAEAQAQLQFYRTQREETLIRAPFAGTITRQFAQVGDFVTPTTAASTTEGSTSTSIAELSSRLEVEAKVPEASIAQIQPGQRVAVRLDAYPDAVLKGKVRSIAPTAVKQDNVTFLRVKVDLAPSQYPAKAGMNAKLNFHVAQIQQALVVPLAAIMTQKDGTTGAFVRDRNGQVHFQAVKVGQTTGDRLQILQGLEVGDRVLLSPPPEQRIEGVDKLEF